MVKAVTTFEHAFLSGKFFINEGLVVFLFFFFGGEAEYMDILPLGMGWMPVVVGLPEVCNHGRLELR